MMKHFSNWFLKISEGLSAAMLLALFLTFLIQVFSRYILQEPFGWTLEVCLTLWLWLIFWSNSFVIKNRDQVTFDIVYFAVNPGTRKIFALISSLSIAVAFGVALYPTWDFIDFLKIKPSTVLQIPMRSIFIIYIVFMVATIATYIIRTVYIVRTGTPDEPKHHTMPGVDDGGSNTREGGGS